MRFCCSTNTEESTSHSRSPPGSLRRCTGRLPEMVEGSLHLVKMRVLPSAHAFVFGAQKRLFIGLPRLFRTNSQTTQAAAARAGYGIALLPRYIVGFH